MSSGKTNVSWSYSAYSTAVQCLQKYKYLYIDKLTPQEPENGDLIFGQALHCALNCAITGQDALQMFEIYWSAYQGKNVTYGRYKWPELAKLGSEFIRKFIKTLAPEMKFLFGEERLYGEKDGFKLDGQPDALVEWRGKRVLLDFKTSSFNYLPEKADTALQLYLYAFLMLENSKGPIDKLGYIVFNKVTGSIQNPVVWDFDEAVMTKKLFEMTKYIDIFDTEVFYPKNANACLDYNKRCPFWTNCYGGNDEGK